MSLLNFGFPLFFSGFVTALMDHYSEYFTHKYSREFFSAAVCVFSFLVGLPCVTQASQSPDRTFQDFRASKYVDRQIIRTLKNVYVSSPAKIRSGKSYRHEKTVLTKYLCCCVCFRVVFTSSNCLITTLPAGWFFSPSASSSAWPSRGSTASTSGTGTSRK